MAEIRPFRGVRYNEQLVNDLASVVCPPYDIITPQMAQELYHRSEYNFVRLEYGRQLPPGTDTTERHAGSAATLEHWLEQGVLKVDEKPAVYLHEYTFTFQGKTCRRLSVTAAVRLTDWDKKVVLPHEATRKKAKSDRLDLLWALGANTSPVLTLFDDKNVSSLMAAEAQKAPQARWSTADGENHKIWVVTDPHVINQISVSLADKPLYIADGHHRYESALNYQRERRACSGEVSGDEEFNFVMMTLVDFADPGLIVLSPHRLVRGLGQTTLSELKSGIASLFDIGELPLNAPDIWQQIDTFLAAGRTDRTRFVLFGLEPERFQMLTLRDFTAAKQMMPYFHGELYSQLSVSIFDHVILKKILGMPNDAEEAFLTFDHDKRDTIARVSEQEYQLAFLLGPIKAGLVKMMADGGERMPRKSTYFHPKPPSGLVLHRLD